MCETHLADMHCGHRRCTDGGVAWRIRQWLTGSDGQLLFLPGRNYFLSHWNYKEVEKVRGNLCIMEKDLQQKKNCCSKYSTSSVHSQMGKVVHFITLMRVWTESLTQAPLIRPSLSSTRPALKASKAHYFNIFPPSSISLFPQCSARARKRAASVNRLHLSLSIGWRPLWQSAPGPQRDVLPLRHLAAYYIDPIMWREAYGEELIL